jgi:hypothetical protein
MITYVANHDDLCMNDGLQKSSQPKTSQSLDTLQRAPRTRGCFSLCRRQYTRIGAEYDTLLDPRKISHQSYLQSGTGVIDRWSALDTFPRRGAWGAGVSRYEGRCMSVWDGLEE